MGGRIWTIDGNDDKNPEDSMSLTEDDETRILLEKEFDDYYEDHVHKSAVCFDFFSVFFSCSHQSQVNFCLNF